MHASETGAFTRISYGSLSGERSPVLIPSIIWSDGLLPFLFDKEGNGANKALSSPLSVLGTWVGFHSQFSGNGKQTEHRSRRLGRLFIQPIARSKTHSLIVGSTYARLCARLSFFLSHPTGLAIPEEERSYLETQPTYDERLSGWLKVKVPIPSRWRRKR